MGSVTCEGGWSGVSITTNPTAEWIAGQVTEAFPWDEAPWHLIRDRDSAFGLEYRLPAKGLPRGSGNGDRAVHCTNGDICQYTRQFRVRSRLDSHVMAMRRAELGKRLQTGKSGSTTRSSHESNIM
jgi:hypothetical protein